MLKEKHYNIYILGAGFSKPAGLPLGNELFRYVVEEMKKPVHWREYKINLYEDYLKKDIEKYIDYHKSIFGKKLDEEEINFEELLSYLDLEHYLRLKGGDTWSEEGNESQVLIRNYISKIIFNRQTEMVDSDYSLYEQFVEKLRPEDLVITFNYDTLLENSLSRKNIQYRLFPHRYDKVLENGGGFLSTTENEVIVLKMHGSIDWFSIKSYHESIKYNLRLKNYNCPHNIIFNDKTVFQPEKIIDEPYPSSSSLQNIYKVKNLDKYFAEANFLTEAPLILSPSMNKILYINPLLDFWSGFSQNGSFSKNIVIIGFSMPEHDAYLRQSIYSIINNFQCSTYQEKYDKSDVILIDYRNDTPKIRDYKNTYMFVNPEKSIYYFDGFNEEITKML